MRKTSLLAYNQILDSLGRRQKIVFDIIEDLGPLNNRQISTILNIPINSITPRVNELVKRKVVKEAYTDKDRISNRLSIYWKVNR